MILFDKNTGEEEIIFGVLDDNHGYPKFLIRKGSQWIYRSAKHYITRIERITTPYEEEKVKDIQKYGYIKSI